MFDKNVYIFENICFKRMLHTRFYRLKTCLGRIALIWVTFLQKSNILNIKVITLSYLYVRHISYITFINLNYRKKKKN